MPIHDWTRVSAGTYHNFHQGWTIELERALNHGVLPDRYYAMVDMPEERRAGEDDRATYARKANRLSVYAPTGRRVALLIAVSPGPKDTPEQFDRFVGTLVDALHRGIHVSLVDLFPPTPAAPNGLDAAIRNRLGGQPHVVREEGRPLTVAAFEATDPLTVYPDSMCVGEPLPDVPLFLAPDRSVYVPLEETYRANWAVTPGTIRALFDRPAT